MNLPPLPPFWLLAAAALFYACGPSEKIGDGESEHPNGATPKAGPEIDPNKPRDPATLPKQILPPSQAPQLPTMQSQARVVYLEAPDDPHRLQVTLSQGGYARFLLGSDPDNQGRRVLHHLDPSGAFQTDAKSKASRAIPEPAGQEVRLWAALREGLYGWQQNPAWKAVPGEPRVRHLDLPGLGHLRANLAENSHLPESIDALNQAGALVQRLEQIEWSKPPEGRPGVATPSSLIMSAGGRQIWKEDQIEVRTGITMGADFFRPVDRRQPQGSSPPK